MSRATAQIPPHIPPSYQGIKASGTILIICGSMTVVAGCLALIFAFIGGQPGPLIVGITAPIAGVFVYGFGQMLLAFRDLVRNSWPPVEIQR